jgi:hypothetical protein
MPGIRHMHKEYLILWKLLDAADAGRAIFPACWQTRRRLSFADSP